MQKPRFTQLVLSHNCLGDEGTGTGFWVWVEGLGPKVGISSEIWSFLFEFHAFCKPLAVAIPQAHADGEGLERLRIYKERAHAVLTYSNMVISGRRMYQVSAGHSLSS